MPGRMEGQLLLHTYMQLPLHLSIQGYRQGCCGCPSGKEKVGNQCLTICTSPKIRSGSTCVCPSLPSNAYRINSNTCSWGCNTGYTKSGNQCVRRIYTPPPVSCPPSGKSHLTRKSGGRCFCPSGQYEIGGNRCCSQASCPLGQKRQSSTSCICVNICPKNGASHKTRWISGNTCACPSGQYEVGGNRCCTRATCPTGQTRNAWSCACSPQTCPESAPCGSPPNCETQSTCLNGDQVCDLSNCPTPGQQLNLATPATCEGE